jgi:hypothetical protein
VSERHFGVTAASALFRRAVWPPQPTPGYGANAAAVVLRAWCRVDVGGVVVCRCQVRWLEDRLDGSARRLARSVAVRTVCLDVERDEPAGVGDQAHVVTQEVATRPRGRQVPSTRVAAPNVGPAALLPEEVDFRMKKLVAEGDRPVPHGAAG